MSLCELLHCSFSELPLRCPSLADKPLLIRYIKEKAEREEYASKGPPPPKTPTVRRR
jgi:hypothetical protein